MLGHVTSAAADTDPHWLLLRKQEVVIDQELFLTKRQFSL